MGVGGWGGGGVGEETVDPRYQNRGHERANLSAAELVARKVKIMNNFK